MMDAIDAKFGVRGRAIIYAWGDTIYNPLGVLVGRELVAHEALHGARQCLTGIEEWWRRYIASDDFRLEEEVLAHRAEYEALLAEHGADRSTRRRMMHHVVVRLTHPVYQYKLAAGEARRRLKEFA